MTDLRTAVAARGVLPASATKMSVRGLNFHYGDFQALKDVRLDIPEKRVTAMIGPTGTSHRCTTCCPTTTSSIPTTMAPFLAK